MKVLITGAAGQVGQTLVRTAPAAAQVLAVSRQDLDIADADTVLEYVRSHSPEVIINAAAYTAVDRAESEPDLARQVNASGPRYLAEAARAAGARLIHISTDFVFDGKGSVPYLPEAVAAPVSVYGRTKLEGEQAVLETLPGRGVIVRTAWVYAAEGKNFVRTMLRVMNTNAAVRVVADQVGTPTAAVSLVETLWKITREPQISGIHHWTDAGVASWYDFAVAIAEEGAALSLVPPTVSVIPIATADYPTPARRPSYSLLDKSSLAHFGLVPTHWRQRLRAVLGEMQRG